MAVKLPRQSIMWLIALLTALFTAILSTTALAQRASTSATGLPSYYPSSYQQAGVIREVNADNTLIISGLKYQISSSTKIHTIGTQFATTWSLKNNEEVGFSFTSDAANNRSISEIWVLPKGSVVLH